MVCTDCTGSCKSNYHAITTTTAHARNHPSPSQQETIHISVYCHSPDMCISVLRVSNLLPFAILILDFGIVPTVWISLLFHLNAQLVLSNYHAITTTTARARNHPSPSQQETIHISVYCHSPDMDPMNLIGCNIN
jgi:hypothetical protein